MQGLCVDRVAHHREYIYILMHSYSDWDSETPPHNALLSSILLLRPSQIRIFSFLRIPLNVMAHRHKDSFPRIVRPAAVMSVNTLRTGDANLRF